MADHFDEDLRRSLTTQASRVPQSYEMGRGAITRARSIRRRRRIAGGITAAAVVALAVPVGLQVGDAVLRTERQIGPATSGTAPSEGPTSEPGPTTGSEPATEPTPSEAASAPPTRTITGPKQIDIDFATLPAAEEPPLVPYMEGQVLVVGNSRIEVDVQGDVVGGAAFAGGAHVYVSRNGGGQLVRVTDGGTEQLGVAAGGPIASPDLRWNAYALGAADKFGNVERGITLAVFDSSDGSTSTVELQTANYVRVVAIIDGTVYYKPERPDGTRQPLSSWVPGEDSPTVVPGSYDATALSRDGRLVAHLTEITDSGTCTQVVDRTGGPPLFDTCDHQVRGFSPDGSYAWAVPSYSEGYSLGDLALLDVQTGEVIRRLPSFDNGLDFKGATFEDDDHLLIQAEQGGQTALVRCTVSTGECEAATPPAQGTALENPPYSLTDG